MDLEQQQQLKQTEELIVEMLDFLESTTDEEDDHVNGKLSTIKSPTVNGKTVQNGREKVVKRSTMNTSKEDSSNKDHSTTAKELKKLNQHYPIWNTREIVSNQKKSLSLPQSPTNDILNQHPIWRQSSLDLLSKPSESLEVGTLYPFTTPTTTTTTADQIKNYQPKLETNFLRSTNDGYVQEVRKAIYGDNRGHPASGSTEYYQAAQNYAIYGKDFLDFPQDFKTILENKSTVVGDAEALGNSQCMTGLQQPTCRSGYQSNEGFSSLGSSSYGRPPVTTSTAMGTAATTNPTIITSVASPSDYYQFCNNMTSQARPVTGNNSPVPIGAAASYGMVMGSKVTYVAATPTPIPAFVYHQQHQQQQQQQHISSQANFISNSLANAALATSPAILYSNPMITATAQHYLNTFFKDNQLLAASGAATTANVGGGSTVPQATAAGIYERLVYAQMLQQQLYQSQQQAAVVAAMLHKQRINVAAAARQTNMSSAGYNNTGAPISANNALGGAANSAPMSSQATLNNCARQATVVANISNANQATMAISEEPSKTAKD